MKRVLLMTVAGLLVASSAMAGMENARFALHAKPKFSPSKTITALCPNAGNNLLTPNYSPNWNSTTTTANPLPCTSYTVSTANQAVQLYVVVGRAGAEGVAAASFGLDYNGRAGAGAGIDPSFNVPTYCADGLTFPNAGPNGLGDFPNPEGGLRITWNNTSSCQNLSIAPAGVHAVVMGLYVYSYGQDIVSITPNNNLQSGAELAVANCAGATTDLIQVWGGDFDIINQVMGKAGVGGAVGYNPCLVTPTAPTTWGKIKAQYKD